MKRASESRREAQFPYHGLERSSAMYDLSTLRGYALIPLLGLSLFLAGCKESPKWSKAGPFFSGEEKDSPTKAVVYVYWPPDQRGGLSQVFVSNCKNFE